MPLKLALSENRKKFKIAKAPLLDFFPPINKKASLFARLFYLLGAIGLEPMIQ